MKKENNYISTEMNHKKANSWSRNNSCLFYAHRS